MKKQNVSKEFIAGFLLVLLLLPLSSQAQLAEETMNSEFKAAETLADYQKFIQKYAPDYLAFAALQIISNIDISKKNWTAVIQTYEASRADFPGMEAEFDKIIKLLQAPEKNFLIQNISDSINTKQDEYCPIISADGKRLYFCRRRDDFQIIDNKIELYEHEDIYVSTLGENQEWGKAKNLGSPICTETHEAPIGISADGTILTLFGNYDGSFGRGDNFYAEKTDSGWSQVKHFPSPINSEYFDAGANYTADGKAILFYSDRPGSVGATHFKNEFYHGTYWGNMDLYICLKTSNGSWSEPINLGETINTPFCESSPFLHPDGKTLYFCSDGHCGLGGLDVFKATRLSDSSWTEWSEPVNLGKEINSPNDDWGYRISTSGKFLYFAIYDHPEGKGKNDIYFIELPDTPDSLKPDLVTTVSGKVTDPDGKPLNAKIKWNDLTLQKEAGELQSDPQSGRYFIPLPTGHRYSYFAEKEGYIGASEYLDLTDKKDFTEYTLDIVLHPVDSIPQLILKNIFFEVDKAELQKESFMELSRWVNLLKEHAGLRCEIHGHTDNTGTAKYNYRLSVQRAKAVVDYLVGKGIDADRLTAIGFGKTKPIAPNDTEEGRQKNRRVEIKFLELAAR